MRSIVFAIIVLVVLAVFGTFAPHSVPWILGVAVALITYGALHQSIWSVLYAMFEPLRSLETAIGGVKGGSAKLQGWSDDLWNDEQMGESSQIIHRSVGIVVTTVVFVLFLFADYFLVAQALRALAPESSALPTVVGNISPELVMGFCIIFGPVFWTTVWSDVVGHTSFGRWRTLSSQHQESMLAISKLFLGMFVVIGVMLAGFRAYSVTVPFADGTDNDAAAYSDYAPQPADTLAELRAQAAMQTANANTEGGGIYSETERVTTMLTLILYPTLAVVVTGTSVAAGWALHGIFVFIAVAVVKVCQMALAILGMVFVISRGVIRWFGVMAESMHNLLTSLSLGFLQISGLAPLVINDQVIENDQHSPEVQQIQESMPRAEESRVDDVASADLEADEDVIELSVEQVERDDHRKWSPF